MVTVFFRVLNMSLTACILIPVVLVLRFLLRKAPRWISCLLWAVVAVRLLCPFPVESVLSLIPSAEPVPQSIITQTHPEVHTGIATVNEIVNPMISESFAPAPGDSVNPLQVYSFAAAVFWMMGMVLLLLYACVSYLMLRHKVKASILWKRNIMICDDIQTPFILGVFRPRIYIPSGLEKTQMNHVVAHENAHLRRCDHMWKPLGYLILAIHWFNPLVWVAYILLCRDIELACDEKVIQKLAKEESVSYSETLLSCSIDRRNILICPLAFGEVSVRERISHVLHYKKPAVWIGAAAVLVCAIVAVCFLTNPKQGGEDEAGAAVENELPGEGGTNLPAPDDTRPITSQPVQAADADALEKASDEKAKTVEEAVYRAILMDGAAKSSTPENTSLYRTASFVKLGEESSEADGGERITVYGMAMYLEADWSKDNATGIKEVSCSYVPAAVTVSVQDGNYQWQEYWTPQDGSYNADSIGQKFPKDIAETALNTQQFVSGKMHCYAQLVEATGYSAFSAIGKCLDLICVADTGSDPQDYIDHAVTEYMNMIYYGEYTLAYRDKFGDDFGGVRAEILNRVCDEIERNMASGYYRKIANPSGELLYREEASAELSGQQAPSVLVPDSTEYENMGVDYVEENGLYIVEGDMVFEYKKVLKGRDPNAAKALVFVVLTNDQDVTWEQVFKSTISSNSNDFLPGTCIIGMKAVDD